MRAIILIAFAACVSLVAGCATPYQKSGLFTLAGGYYDEQMPSCEYRVGFGANGFTKLTDALDYAQLRCAELTLEKGSKFFEVVQGGGGMRENAFWNGHGVSYAQKPNAEYIIRLHDEPPANPTGPVFDAAEVKKDVLARQVKLTRPTT